MPYLRLIFTFYALRFTWLDAPGSYFFIVNSGLMYLTKDSKQ